MQSVVLSGNAFNTPIFWVQVDLILCEHIRPMPEKTLNVSVFCGKSKNFNTGQCSHLHDHPPLSGTCTCSRPTPRCNLSQKPPHLHRSLQLLRSTVTFAATKSGFLPLLMKHPLSPGPHLDNSPAVMSLQEDSSSSLLHW